MYRFALFSRLVSSALLWCQSILITSVFGQQLQRRAYWLAAILVALTCSSPSGQLLGGSPLRSAFDAAGAGQDAAAESTSTAQRVSRSSQQAARKHVLRGEALLTAFEWQAAEVQFQRGIELDPGSTDGYLGLANVYLGLKSPQVALEASRGALHRAQRSGGATQQDVWADLVHQRALASSAWQQGSRSEHQDLLASIEEALQRYPADPDLYVLRGQVETHPMATGRDSGEGAIGWYRQALELEPDHRAAHYYLAHILRTQGRLQAARQHAERHLNLVATPQSYMFLAQLLLELGEPRIASERLLEADGLHRTASSSRALGWGADLERAENLELLVAVEEGLGDLDAARRHAEELFDLEVEGRRAGQNCLPLLQQLQHVAEPRVLLVAARRCEAKVSLLAQVLGAVYRGDALLALGRWSAADKALQEAETAQRLLVADLSAQAAEKRHADAAQHGISMLQGKLQLLAGERRAGEQQLMDLVHRLARRSEMSDWMTGRQYLREISSIADRSGHFGLAMASSRALERLTPEGLRLTSRVHWGDETQLAAADAWHPSASSWVVWAER